MRLSPLNYFVPFIHLFVNVRRSTHVEIKGQLAEVSACPPCESRDSNSAQVWLQASWPTELCCWPSPACAQCLARLASEPLDLPVSAPNKPPHPTPLLARVARADFTWTLEI